jgi:SET domain-containing protein
MEIKALREIKKDEEITIDYHNDYEGKVTLWFESKE